MSFFVCAGGFWMRWVFTSACRLSLVAVSRATACCGAWAFTATASPVAERRFDDTGFAAVGPWAQLLQLRL